MNMSMNIGQASLDCLTTPPGSPSPIGSPIPQPPGVVPPNTPVNHAMTGSIFAQLQNDYLEFER